MIIVLIKVTIKLMTNIMINILINAMIHGSKVIIKVWSHLVIFRRQVAKAWHLGWDWYKLVQISPRIRIP